MKKHWFIILGFPASLVTGADNPPPPSFTDRIEPSALILAESAKQSRGGSSSAYAATPMLDIHALQHQFAERVLDSDHVTVTEFDQKKMKFGNPITINDRTWIEELSKILSAAVFLPMGHVLAIGPPITFYDKEGHEILTLQVFGTVIRLNSHDFEVGRETASAISALVMKKKPDQSPVPNRRG